MRKRILLLIFLAVSVFALFYKSPFSALYNYNTAKNLYNQGQYEQSLPYFERSLFADNKGILARFYYALALSKSKPVYSVQKKLYEMSTSKINDEATRFAKSQISYLRHSLLEDIGDNYIYQAIAGTDIIRWNINSFPLKVYIENKKDMPEYYIESINKALNMWSLKTNFIKFTQTTTPDDANIIINFKNMTDKECGSECKFVSAHTEPEIIKNNILKKMNLTFNTTNPHNVKFSPAEIYNTALHEIGHTLGIMGHSDNPNDAMYAEQNITNSEGFFKSENYSLSNRDLNTIVLLYRLAPTISNSGELKSESFYYPPIIVGNDTQLLEKKLKELTQYIEKYPDIAAGYINITAIYSELGDINKAKQSLEIAEQKAKTPEEKYLILYNKAVLQFNLQNSKEAFTYAKQAQAINDSPQVRELISDIENMGGK